MSPTHLLPATTPPTQYIVTLQAEQEYTQRHTIYRWGDRPPFPLRGPENIFERK